MHLNINKTYFDGIIPLLSSGEYSSVTLPINLLNRGYNDPEYTIAVMWKQNSFHGGDEFYMKIDNNTYHMEWKDEWENPMSQYEKGDVHYFQTNLFENPDKLIREYNRPKNYIVYIWKVSLRYN